MRLIRVALTVSLYGAVFLFVLSLAANLSSHFRVFKGLVDLLFGVFFFASLLYLIEAVVNQRGNNGKSK